MNVLELTPDKLKDRRFTIDDLANLDGRVEIWERPKPGLVYVIGGDCAYGIQGRDYDAGVSLAKGDGKPRQVFELHGHWGERFDRLLYPLARLYNNAFIVLERQVGLPILRRIWGEYGYRNIYFERKEEKVARPFMDTLGHPRVQDDFTLRNLRRAAMEGAVLLRSKTLIDQMARLEFFAKGEEPGVNDRVRDEAMRVRLPGGGSPDLVMAACYAWLGIQEVTHFPPPPPEYPPDSLGKLLGHDEIEEKMSGRDGASIRNRRLR